MDSQFELFIQSLIESNDFFEEDELSEKMNIDYDEMQLEELDYVAAAKGEDSYEQFLNRIKKI